MNELPTVSKWRAGELENICSDVGPPIAANAEVFDTW